MGGLHNPWGPVCTISRTMVHFDMHANTVAFPQENSPNMQIKIHLLDIIHLLDKHQ